MNLGDPGDPGYPGDPGDLGDPNRLTTGLSKFAVHTKKTDRRLQLSIGYG